MLILQDNDFPDTPQDDDVYRSNGVVRLVVVLALTAAGALAVAGFRQSDSPTPIRQLVENVSNITLDSQISSLGKDRLRLYRISTKESSSSNLSIISRTDPM